MTYTPTRRLDVAVPAEVLELARRRVARRLRGSRPTLAEVTRLALAELAGVDPEAYPVRPRGRPWPEKGAEPEREAVAG